jgi:hypothetical protein
MDLKEQQAKDDEERAKRPPENGVGRGYLGLSGVLDLDDMNVDLSAQLNAKRKPLVAPQPQRIPMRPVEAGQKRSYTDPPTPGESRRWSRGSNYIQRSVVTASTAVAASERDSRDSDEVVTLADKAAAVRQAEADEYERMKKETSRWTTATAAACFVLVYSYYTKVCTCSLP